MLKDGTMEDYPDIKWMVDFYLSTGAYEALEGDFMNLGEATREKIRELLKGSHFANAPEYLQKLERRIYDESDGTFMMDEVTKKRWAEINEMLGLLKINVGKMKCEQYENGRREDAEQKEMRITDLLAKAMTGRMPKTDGYLLVASCLANRHISEKFKIDALTYFPKLAKFSTREQKDILINAAYNLVQHGDEIKAGDKLRRAALYTLGYVLSVIQKIQKEMDGLPEKDRIFSPPANTTRGLMECHGKVHLTIGDRKVVRKIKG